MVLTYYKIKDDLSDKGFLRKIRAVLLLPFASSARKKALSSGKEAKKIDLCAAKMIEEQRPHIIFVLPDADDWKAISTLSDLGKVEMTDYFIIPQIFGPKDGGYVDVPADLIW